MKSWPCVEEGEADEESLDSGLSMGGKPIKSGKSSLMLVLLLDRHLPVASCKIKGSHVLAITQLLQKFINSRHR